MPVQKLKVAVLPLDLPCSGFINHSGEIPTTEKSHKRHLKDDVQLAVKLKYITNLQNNKIPLTT